MDKSLFISHDIFWKIEKPFFDIGAESPIFSLYRTRWKLKLEVTQDKYYRGETHFEVHLTVTDAPVNYSNANFSVSCKWKRNSGKATSEKTTNVKISDLLSGKSSKIYENSVSGLQGAICEDLKKAWNDFAACIRTDNIYFVCSIAPEDIGQDSIGLHEEQFPVLSLPCADSLSRDFERALYNSEYTDVILNCGDKSIPAHKAILASRSEVFEAMFRNNLKESLEGIVNIIDIEPQIFEQLIHYIYTGHFTGSTVESMCNIYKAAHKYNVESLKERCIRFIKENLETHQACDVLIIADTYHESDLKMYVMSYIVNRKDFLLSEKWVSFSKVCTYLAQEVFLLFVQKAEIKSTTSEYSNTAVNTASVSTCSSTSPENQTLGVRIGVNATTSVSPVFNFGASRVGFGSKPSH